MRGLKKPGSRDSKPIFLEDEVPRDFFFPASLDDIREAVATLAKADATTITHVYLRRAKSSEFRSGRIPFAEYVRADGICLIALYPWPKHLQTPLTHKPGDAIMNRYKRWAPRLQSHKGKWSLQWDAEPLKDFFLSEIFKSEILCHVAVVREIENLAGKLLRRNKAELFARQRFFEDTVEIF